MESCNNTVNERSVILHGYEVNFWFLCVCDHVVTRDYQIGFPVAREGVVSLTKDSSKEDSNTSLDGRVNNFITVRTLSHVSL